MIAKQSISVYVLNYKLRVLFYHTKIIHYLILQEINRSPIFLINTNMYWT